MASQNIAFVISDHGFGHIMREVPVMAHLLANTNDRILLVCGERHIDLALRYFRSEIPESRFQERLTAIPLHTDYGIDVVPGTLKLDRDRLEHYVRESIAGFPQKIALLTQWLKDFKATSVVVDIAPWAFQAACNAGIPSFLMASFTWIEIYEEYLGEDLVEPYRKLFSLADNILLYGLANEPTLQRFPNGIPVGFVTRPFHEDKVQKIRNASKQPIVFVSLGGSNSGLRDPIDVNDLPYHFITTGAVVLHGSNVESLPTSIENTQDYVAASDWCISKPGWSTLSEIILAKKPVALISRPDVAEDRLSTAEMVRRGAAISITVPELTDLRSILKRMQEKRWTLVQEHNQAARIAANIRSIRTSS